MKKKIWLMTMLLILLCTTVGCGSQSETTHTITNQTAENETETIYPAQGIVSDSNMQWPVYLPDDIPVLAGDIRLVMGSPDTNVRIFYEPLSERLIKAYVQLCAQKGFAIKYLVYTQEGFPDNSAERIKSGEFDAIDITKGDYALRLECGSDLATLDIQITSATPRNSPTTIPWPADIKPSVPQPEQCWVRNIANLSYGGYQIVCQYADGNLRLNEYLQVLTTLGFQETDRLINDHDEIVHVTLETESMSVKLMPHSPSSTMTFQVWPKNP
ncbi:MAG: hypothetical protein PHV74_09910 [Dehalococcoidia bacterium]|nr:hypothetical protein [Dehalococcoidia bacterium]